MLDLGRVRPGQTIHLPFDSFAGATGAPITMTDHAVGDILVYRDGGTTERASTAGFTITANFDSHTGLHYVAIDLADNTTAQFYQAGGRYMVGIGPVTIDSQTMKFWLARFVIGYEGAILDTSLATLASQTEFTLAAGSTDNDAYNGCDCIIHDIASAVQIAQGVVLDYVGASKTLTLASDPGIFTMAQYDNISIFPRRTIYALGAGAKAEVNAEVDTALGDIHLDHLLAATVSTDFTGECVDNSIVARIIAAGDTSDFNQSLESLKGIAALIAALNNLSAAQVNAEVDSALNTAIPGSPTADSVNERLVALDAAVPALAAKFPGLTVTGAVVDDASNSATTFKTDLTATNGNAYKDALLLMTSGDQATEVKKITAYDSGTKFITVLDGFTDEPAENDTFIIVNQ